MSGLPLVTCPSCQTEAPLEVYLGTDDARGVVEIMARMPGPPALRKSALRYVALFAPASQRLRWGRVERLLSELVAIMETGRVERQGRNWPAPIDYWQHGIDAVLANATLRRPLKSHGYLLEVIAGHANSTEAQAERRSEATRAGTTPVGGLARREPEPEPEKPRARRETIAAALAAAKNITQGKQE